MDNRRTKDVQHSLSRDEVGVEDEKKIADIGRSGDDHRQRDFAGFRRIGQVELPGHDARARSRVGVGRPGQGPGDFSTSVSIGGWTSGQCAAE